MPCIETLEGERTASLLSVHSTFPCPWVNSHLFGSWIGDFLATQVGISALCRLHPVWHFHQMIMPDNYHTIHFCIYNPMKNCKIHLRNQLSNVLWLCTVYESIDHLINISWYSTDIIILCWKTKHCYGFRLLAIHWLYY